MTTREEKFKAASEHVMERHGEVLKRLADHPAGSIHGECFDRLCSGCKDSAVRLMQLAAEEAYTQAEVEGLRNEIRNHALKSLQCEGQLIERIGELTDTLRYMRKMLEVASKDHLWPRPFVEMIDATLEGRPMKEIP